MRMPTFYLSHGGGPWPYIDGPFRSSFALMEQALVDIPTQLPEAPRAVLVVSGHWERPEFTLASSAKPGMVYDYHGFPPHTYKVTYPAPGAPAMAERVATLLRDSGWPAVMDPARGYDHGTFSVLKPIYPGAEVPVLQMSLKNKLDANEHLAMGHALAPLREEGVLIIGSGMSYHNLNLLGPLGSAPSAVFDGWLRRTLLEYAPAERRQALIDWKSAPSAYTAHPRADHLLPLMVAAGAAGDEPATCIYGEVLWDHLHVSSFRFGSDRRPSGFDRLGSLGADTTA